MSKKYLTLFQVGLQHSFYADGRAKELVLEPSAATRQFMQQYDLRLGLNLNEYVMVYGQEVGSVAKLCYAGRPVLLRFTLRSTSPYFLNVTDLPFVQQGEQILYFDNLMPEDQPGSLALNNDAPTATVSGDYMLPVYSGILRVSNNGTLPEGLKPALEMQPAQEMPSWNPIVAGDLTQGFQVNLHELSSGKYGYRDANGQEKWFFYPDKELRPGDLGVVDIYLGKNITTMVPLPDAKIDDDLSFNPELPKRHYQISFESRSTRWRYNVINRHTPTLSGLEIDDGQGFSVGETRQIASDEAMTMVSNTALKLQERQTLKPKLKLIKTKSSGGHNGTPSTLDLPTPDWRNITAENGGEVYSDMYVFL